jgi:hypothetical protein
MTVARCMPTRVVVRTRDPRRGLWIGDRTAHQTEPAPPPPRHDEWARNPKPLLGGGNGRVKPWATTEPPTADCPTAVVLAPPVKASKRYRRDYVCELIDRSREQASLGRDG